MMIKTISAALAVLILLFAVAGCSQGTGNISDEDASPNAASFSEPDDTANTKENNDGQKTQPYELTEYVYEFDPHVLSNEYAEVWGADFEQRFYGFCDAVLAGKDTFPCASREEYFRMLSAAASCFPLAPAVIDRNKAEVSDGTGYITYNTDKDRLAEKIAAFKKKVSDVISSAVPYDEDDFIIAMELYTAVTRKDNYDEDNLDLSSALLWQPYRAITEDVGICQEIAGEYVYYLLQTGINALTCSGLSSDSSFAHTWVLVELDGKYYHMDPTFGIEYKDSLLFFGMDDVHREHFGGLPVENYSYGETELIKGGTHSAASDRFAQLWLAQKYSIEHSERRITIEKVSLTDEGAIIPGEEGETVYIDY